jgi:hypothetical protein
MVNRVANPFRVDGLFLMRTQGCRLRSNLWAKISERLRRNFLRGGVPLSVLNAEGAHAAIEVTAVDAH